MKDFVKYHQKKSPWIPRSTYPLVNFHITMENPPILWLGKSTISMGPLSIANCYKLPGWVYSIKSHEIPLNHQFPMDFLWFSYGFPMVLPGHSHFFLKIQCWKTPLPTPQRLSTQLKRLKPGEVCPRPQPPAYIPRTHCLGAAMGQWEGGMYPFS